MTVTYGSKWREPGHADKLVPALEACLPEDFNFAVRVNADILAVDGSAEALATCAASLALQNAGVPLDTVAGSRKP